MLDAVVRVDTVTTAGFQGKPDQWFGGPVLSREAGSMVLRDGAGHVADSLNYGLLVDPWASEGYQAVSGSTQNGCRVTTPGVGRTAGRPPFPVLTNSSAGRRTDGGDNDSNCTDFVVSPATNLPLGAAIDAINIKVGGVADFRSGQTILLGTGAERETAVIASVGTAGATTAGASLDAGASMIPVASVNGFMVGQAITIDNDANSETATIAAVNGGRGGPAVTVAAPLARAHAPGTTIAGTGITLSKALARTHAPGTQVVTDLPTPGAPNQYSAAK